MRKLPARSALRRRWLPSKCRSHGVPGHTFSAQQAAICKHTAAVRTAQPLRLAVNMQSSGPKHQAPSPTGTEHEFKQSLVSFTSWLCSICVPEGDLSDAASSCRRRLSWGPDATFLMTRMSLQQAMQCNLAVQHGRRSPLGGTWCTMRLSGKLKLMGYLSQARNV